MLRIVYRLDLRLPFGTMGLSGWITRLMEPIFFELILYELEQEGTLILELSQDGNTLSGNAMSISGSWAGSVIFERIK